MDPSQTYAERELKSELARFCLPAANRDPNRKLVWVNSICLLFLLIGLVGAKPAAINIQAPPPIEEVIPAVLEPLPPPPTRIDAQQNPEENNQDKPEVPQVVVVTPESPAINFSIPTIGNLIVPNAVAAAPPTASLKPLAPVRSGPMAISSSGKGGDRPAPTTYPPIAKSLGQQGTVLLSMSVDANGTITAIDVKESSGFPILDRSALEFVKRHWILPAGAAGRIFEAPIKYELK